MGRHFKQLTYTARLKIEMRVNAGVRVRDIAAELGVHPSTIYRELKRARYVHLDGETWTTSERYSPEAAEQDARYKAGAKGAPLKIGHNYAVAEYIEDLILRAKWSPAAVCAALQRPENVSRFGVTFCRATLYKYIDDGNIFPNVTRRDLRQRGERRHGKKTIVPKRAPKGRSIEQRPAEVETRQTFGHWEMDTVAGRKGDRARLLVLTERKTRYEIMIRLANGTTESVVRALDKLERRFGSSFYRAFKTITADNGSEFMDLAGMERSCRRNGTRTTVYYCHPYTASERGTNENVNRMIRWHFPKGTSFETVTASRVRQAEDWINSYPRSILDFEDAETAFWAELEAA